MLHEHSAQCRYGADHKTKLLPGIVTRVESRAKETGGRKQTWIAAKYFLRGDPNKPNNSSEMELLVSSVKKGFPSGVSSLPEFEELSSPNENNCCDEPISTPKWPSQATTKAEHKGNILKMPEDPTKTCTPRKNTNESNHLDAMKKATTNISPTAPLCSSVRRREQSPSYGVKKQS